MGSEGFFGANATSKRTQDMTRGPVIPILPAPFKEKHPKQKYGFDCNTWFNHF